MSGNNVSFADLLVQVPLWLSPVVTLLCLIGILSLIRNPSRLSLLLVVWLAIPFLAEAIFIRDVRYLLTATFGITALVATLVERNARHARRLAAITLAFVTVFLVLTAPIAQQQYYGVTQASSELQHLGLANSRILTNVPEISQSASKRDSVYDTIQLQRELTPANHQVTGHQRYRNHL